MFLKAVRNETHTQKAKKKFSFNRNGTSEIVVPLKSHHILKKKVTIREFRKEHLCSLVNTNVHGSWI